MYFDKCDSVRAFRIKLSSGFVLPTTFHLFNPIHRGSIVGSLTKPPPPVLDLCVDWLHLSSHIHGNIDLSSKFKERYYLTKLFLFQILSKKLSITFKLFEYDYLYQYFSDYVIF